MSPLEHRIREAVDALVSRLRHDQDAHVRALTSDLLRLSQENQDQWRAEFERNTTEAKSNAERDFRSRLESLTAELERELDVRLAKERAELQVAIAAAKSSVRDSRVDTLARLLGSIRKLDECTSLTNILEALARGAASETSRVAILLVDGDILRVWGHFGFAHGQGPFELPIGRSGVLAAAVALKQTSFVPPAVVPRDSTMPSFMHVPVGHTGLVVPMAVGGEVVAVLYADDVGRTEEQEDAPVWTEEVDLLVRHASLRLENLTSARTVELFTQ